ncbi:MAG: hypothetical protein KDK39_08130 [Leptospiraceae bacterium]|nr:hypothetical protein [Leptospiraceae bacterium]
MERIAIRGNYKRNSRGRAYLVYYDKNRQRQIFRISSKLDARNGETINVVGIVNRNWIAVISYHPCVFSRKHGRQATTAA